MPNCTLCGFDVLDHPIIEGKAHCIGSPMPVRDTSSITYTITYRDTNSNPVALDMCCDTYKLAIKLGSIIKHGGTNITVTALKT